MKKVFLSIIMVFATVTMFAQFIPGIPPDIVNSNPGNVLITPTAVAVPTTANLHVYNPLLQATMDLDGPYAVPAANRVIGNYDITNSTTGDKLRLVLRWRNGNHEMVQSCYSSAAAGWLAYNYLNLGTGKYEMRGGVNDAEFLNSGDVFFNNTGGVGVGVSALGSGAKFQVDGKIVCKEVEVKITPWPDYVFESSYNLRPLSEVEAFILENKHLPDVPSAAEVEEGVALGEMNAILLQKVEELTLYVIELQKEIETMKAE